MKDPWLLFLDDLFTQQTENNLLALVPLTVIGEVVAKCRRDFQTLVLCEVQQTTRNITSSRPENRPNFESPHIHIIHVDRSVTHEWRNMHFIAEHHHHGNFDGMNHKQSRSQSSKVSTHTCAIRKIFQ